MLLLHARLGDHIGELLGELGNLRRVLRDVLKRLIAERLRHCGSLLSLWPRVGALGHTRSKRQQHSASSVSISPAAKGLSAPATAQCRASVEPLVGHGASACACLLPHRGAYPGRGGPHGLSRLWDTPSAPLVWGVRLFPQYTCCKSERARGSALRGCLVNFC